jgi:hypothetical protein
VHYLPQQIPQHGTVATLAGVQDTIEAVQRIENGSADAQDFDAVGEHWDIRERLQSQLDRNGLPACRICARIRQPQR